MCMRAELTHIYKDLHPAGGMGVFSRQVSRELYRGVRKGQVVGCCLFYDGWHKYKLRELTMQHGGCVSFS